MKTPHAHSSALDVLAPSPPSRPRAVTGGFATQLLIAATPIASPVVDAAPSEPVETVNIAMSGGDVATSRERAPAQPQAARRKPTIDATADVVAATAAAVKPVPPASDVANAQPTRTPLEQAVHDLLAQLDSDDKQALAPTDEGMQLAAQTKLAEAAPLAPVAQPVVARAAAPDAPIAQPDPPPMQSAHHAHIVLGDDDHRVVMTVAVRGANVSVTVKATDERTAAALARNASSLDEAMRHRGLELDAFEADRESPHHRDEPERQPESTEPFELEESV